MAFLPKLLYHKREPTLLVGAPYHKPHPKKGHLGNDPHSHPKAAVSLHLPLLHHIPYGHNLHHLLSTQRDDPGSKDKQVEVTNKSLARIIRLENFEYHAALNSTKCNCYRFSGQLKSILPRVIRQATVRSFLWYHNKSTRTGSIG